MTNLSPDRPAWRHQITRERFLVAVPGLLGLLLAGGLFTALGWPALERMDQQRQRLEELQSKRDSLPLLEAQLTQSDKSLSQAKQQQALLVDLVAGRGQIQTFLAQLSRISAASGVVITLYEPLAGNALEASNPNGDQNQQNKGDDSTAATNDPLQALGYEKSAVLLQVEGPYQGLLQFLRGMELLELLVQPSDLELTAVEAPDQSENQAMILAPPRTRLKLRLTFFDQAAKAANGDNSRSQGSAQPDGNPPPLSQAPS